MTDRMKALDALIEAVEAGRWDVRHFPINTISQYTEASGAFHGSLDAALALHESLLPGYWWAVEPFPLGGGVSVGQSENCRGPWFGMDETPARAWLIAILKAYREAQK